MFIRRIVFSSLLCSFMVLNQSYAADSNISIYSVDVNRVLKQSSAAMKADEHLGEVQSFLQNELNNRFSEVKKLPEKDRQAVIQQSNNIFIQSLEQARITARQSVLEYMNRNISKWKKEHKADNSYILDKNLFLSAPLDRDITIDIISLMDREEVTLPPMPQSPFQPLQLDQTLKQKDSGQKKSK